MTEEQFPAWADELRQRYLASEASIFLLHGNVNDLYPWQTEEGIEFVSLSEFLRKMLDGKKDIVINYNLSSGFRVRKSPQATLSKLFEKKMEHAKSNSSLHYSLKLMEDLIVDRNQNIALIMEYAETILPMNQLNYMGEEERSNMIRLMQWTKNDYLSTSNNIVIMITENLSEMHRRFSSSTQVAIIEIALPTESIRQEFTRQHIDLSFTDGMDAKNFSSVCAGLTLVQMQGIIRRAEQKGASINFQTVNLHKKSIIEQECHGLIEFISPKHDFSHVGGQKELKSELLRISNAIKQGHRNQVPMGMLFVGPMGTGKTYIGEAFAGESGLTCIKFKNFRERWVGATEGNFEKILQVVKALGYVLLIIDEADRSMGGGDSDGGTSSRVIARLKEFMSNTEHRGRIVIVMMTNRPDKIDVDLKRPGRLDYKIPFFFPQDVETRTAIMRALIRKNKILLTEDIDLEAVQGALIGFSAAELEAVLLRAIQLATMGERGLVSQEDLAQASEDVLPSRDIRMLEYMEMLAVFEASSRQMLPSKYRELSVDQIQQRLDQLRLQLGLRI